MDVWTISIGISMLVIGFLLGRRSAQGERAEGRTIRSQADDPSANAEIERLVREGTKIQAIKLYRETYQVDLKVAKDAIDAMAARLSS